MNDTPRPRPLPAHAAGTATLGDRTVHRLGFGAMQLTGPGVWGPPTDREEALAVLRRAVELGIDLIDTADSYGPDVSEELIREALHPYPEHLVIATKAGLERPAPGEWRTNCRPERLIAQCEGSLVRLGVERIDLFQLHRIDPAVPLADQLGALVELQRAGKIAHIGLSEVTVDQLVEASTMATIVSVQNMYNLVNRGAEPVLEHCEREGIAFIPWIPLGGGSLSKPGGPLDDVADRLRISPAQVALAWLLERSPAMLPIPGTSRVSNLEDNVAAANVRLIDADLEAIETAVGGSKIARGLRSVRDRISRKR
jgi:pyridoxine 4-dehydrogenase